MNIKISHNWLLEYLDTKASHLEIQKYLSLCGPSIEKVDKIGDDYIYDIEITSNRVDTASVYGIAREAATILSRFGIKSTLKPLRTAQTPLVKKTDLPLEVTDSSRLCRRILAIVMDNISIKPSSQKIQTRLETAGIRSLNSVVDITNYVMTEVGHPTHVFDYDRIKSHKLIIRKAKKNEEIVTLDEKKYHLNEEDIIIDDGTGKVIDLPGIMGTANSVVTPETKRIIFFIESNDPKVIRRSSMRYGIRSVAATINEKSPDLEAAKIAFLRGIELFKEMGAQPASDIIDIYPHPQKPKTVSIHESDVARLIGISIPAGEVKLILANLGFKLISETSGLLHFEVPSYRTHDIAIKEDLIEEIARVYGYDNLPNNLPPPAYVPHPKETEMLFDYQTKIKYFLKHLGLTEVMNYSMISKEMIENFGLKISEHLKIKDSISEEHEYLRIHLTPSLVANIKDNEGKKEDLKLFEIAKTYKKQEGDLPIEKLKLGIVVNSDFFDLKGIFESLFDELNIDNVQIRKSVNPVLSDNLQGQIIVAGEKIGEFGQLLSEIKLKLKIKSEVFLCIVDFESLMNNAKLLPTYRPIHPYAIVKLDLTLKPEKPFEEIKNLGFRTSKYLQNIELVSLFQNKLSLRFYFSSPVKNLTEEEAKAELEKINLLIRSR